MTVIYVVLLVIVIGCILKSYHDVSEEGALAISNDVPPYKKMSFIKRILMFLVIVLAPLISAASGYLSIVCTVKNSWKVIKRAWS